MDPTARRAYHAMLDAWLDRPPADGMAAILSLAVGYGTPGASLIAVIESGSRECRYEAAMPTPGAAAVAARGFGEELDGMDALARSRRVLDGVTKATTAARYGSN